MPLKNTPELLICDCSSREHQIIMAYDDDDNLVYSTVHLTKHSFWKRLKYGFRYIFGYQCRYGAFDEFILSDKHIEQLERVVNKLKEGPKDLDS